MTIDTTIDTTIDITLDRLKSEYAELLSPLDMPAMSLREMEAYETKRSMLHNRIRVIQESTRTLAEVAPELESLTTWHGHLVNLRQKLCDKLEVCPPRDPQLSGLRLSVLQIDRGLDFRNQAFPARLPLDDLMAEVGISTTGTLAETCGAYWRGSLPGVEQRLRELQSRLDDAQVRLDAALKDEQPS